MTRETLAIETLAARATSCNPTTPSGRLGDLPETAFIVRAPIKSRTLAGSPWFHNQEDTFAAAPDMPSRSRGQDHETVAQLIGTSGRARHMKPIRTAVVSPMLRNEWRGPAGTHIELFTVSAYSKS